MFKIDLIHTICCDIVDLEDLLKARAELINSKAEVDDTSYDRRRFLSAIKAKVPKEMKASGLQTEDGDLQEQGQNALEAPNETLRWIQEAITEREKLPSDLTV